MCASNQGNEGVHLSTLESFDQDAVEGVVNGVFGSNPFQPPPRRFAMENLVRVDDGSMGLLQASSLWKESLAHIERIVERERLLSAERSDFVARTFRQRPGVVYAVRYWEELANVSSLAMVLEKILQAWIACKLPNSQSTPNQGAARHMHASDNGRDGGSVVDAHTTDRKSLRPAEGQEPASVDRRKGSTTSTKFVSPSQGPGIQEDERFLVKTQKVAMNDPHHDAARRVQLEGFEAGNVAPTVVNSEIVNSLPEDTSVPGRTPSDRSCPVRVLGFAVELDSSSRQARVALIAEWPGIGSLQDLLSGNVQVAGGASQEDLLRWTRQIAEGLVHANWGGSDGADKESAPRVSTTTAYLFQRPMDEFQQGASMLDVRLAPFLGGSSMPDEGGISDTAQARRSLLPPEVLCCEPDAVLKPSPTTSNVGPGQRRAGSEAADVWGIGTLVFELATGRLAGPVPLAFRPLRDLMREVPIDPHFIYGDVARGVMRLALQRQPGRARASDIAAAVEQIAARTLKRAHTASDRQNRARRIRRREAVDGSAAGEKGTDEDDGDTNDGYGKALTQWRINEAVERAQGRARVFLRRLWFNSLTEEDKRRIRHRRRHRKANKEARAWRARRVRAAKMHHWTPVQVATWISHLLWKAESSRKLPLLFSGDAKGGIASMGADDAEENKTADCEIAPSGEMEQDETDMTASKGRKELRSSGTAAITGTEKKSSSFSTAAAGAAATAATPPAPAEVDPSSRENKQNYPCGDPTTADDVTVEAEKGHGRRNRNNDEDSDGPNRDKEYDTDHAYDHQSSSVEGGDDNGDNATGWADVEAGERTGYAGASAEPFAVKEAIDGSCLMEAMDDALGHAEDTLTRFVKSSTRLARPAEVERKRVELMVRELLTVRPYSERSQLKIRALCVVIVRSAEAPRDLTENQIDAQLPSLARVLTAGYRGQMAMVEQGLEFAAARIQGLARGKHIRRICAKIWQQAEEYARNIVRGEREARIKKEKEQRAKEKEEDLEREREEAKRYRLRLVPRVSSVTCRGMVVSLPPFLAAAARGARRFLVVETTVAPPRSLPIAAPLHQRASSPSDDRMASSTRGVGTPATVADADSPVVAKDDRNGTERSNGEANCEDGGGQIHVLLRQGAAAELQEKLDGGPMTPSTPPATATSSQPGGSGTEKTRSGEPRENQGRRIFLRAVGNGVSLSSLCPCTTYRLTLEIPPIVRDELLESGSYLVDPLATRFGTRSLRLAEAIRSLETPTASDANARNGGDRVGGDHTASLIAHLDVETLPDVPSEVPSLTYKVLTSASAVDPRDPSGVISLRQWQSPYPGVADMDGPSSEDYIVLAPGRPEPLVSLQWEEPKSNGLNVCSYVVERRVGRTEAWKKIRAGDARGDTTTTVGRSSPKRRDGGIRGTKGQHGSTDAVDAPLRSVSVDALRKVAVEGLLIAYRVYAENVLGAGAPSTPVEVNLGAFLGHLRAQQGGRRAPAASCGQQQQQSLAEKVLPACVANMPSPAAANEDDSPFSDAHHANNLTPDREAQQQAADRGGPLHHGIAQDGAQEAGAKTPHSQDQSKGTHAALAPDVPSPQAAAAFGDDFMGLASFGERRVHNLFSPPSPSPSRRDRRTRPRAPAAGGALGGADQILYGVGGYGSGKGGHGNGPYPLPPIVLASGISSASRRILSTTERPGSQGGRQNCGSDDNVFRGRAPVARRALDSSDLDGRKSRSGGKSSANANEVFHAFINLGRRLPGRLPRDRGPKEREPR